jgi:hypothetical protein
MQTMGNPSMTYLPRSIPGCYRWARNVVVYSLTHGNISDHDDYVPENYLANEPVPTSAPVSVHIPSTPVPLDE